MTGPTLENVRDAGYPRNWSANTSTRTSTPGPVGGVRRGLSLYKARSARRDDQAAGPHGGKPVNARLKAVFDRLKVSPAADPALRCYFLDRTGFGGPVNYALPSRLQFTNTEGWNVVAGDALERAAALLKGVPLTCGDFAPLLAEPGPDVWAYCDPPTW